MFAPGPAASRSWLRTLVTQKRWNDEFALIAAIFRAAVLRAQSECARFCGQRAAEKPPYGEGPEKQAAIGIASEKLVVKLRERNRMVGRSQIVKACVGNQFPRDLLGFTSRRCTARFAACGLLSRRGLCPGSVCSQAGAGGRF